MRKLYRPARLTIELMSTDVHFPERAGALRKIARPLTRGCLLQVIDDSRHWFATRRICKPRAEPRFTYRRSVALWKAAPVSRTRKRTYVRRAGRRPSRRSFVLP